MISDNINYKFPAVLGDTLDVQTSLLKIGKSSITFQQEIRIKENRILLAFHLYVLKFSQTEASIYSVNNTVNTQLHSVLTLVTSF